MTASTWARAKQLLAEAAEYPPAERERYVIEHCADPELQREVIALLATPAPLSDIVAAGALQLQPGARLGAYVVECQIGSGGMGEVYRARDSRLGRNVAIKVLPPLFAEDRERLARFEREARLLASLNHPNICTLFDVGRERETSFIAMELLEGRTLREHIGGKPLHLPELLELSSQIVDALAAMHQNGIVHRDIKPSNIFVTDRGQAKLLDVGLAKSPALQTADSVGPTINEQQLTNAGMALGTVAYMSPEQARGEELDARTDLFSFGAVLYEMATGRTPFSGGTAATIFNAVLNTTPTSPGKLNPALPAEMERVIAKLLEKERELRYQTAAELRVDLRRIKRATESSSDSAAASIALGTRWWRRSAILLVLLLVVAAAAALFGGLLRRKPGGPSSTQWIQLTQFDDSAVSPALSPDGSMVAFIRGPLPYLTKGQIYVKVLPYGEARQLTHDESPKMAPVFSPDNARIAYTVPWDTWTVPVLGGEPRRLLQNATGLTWIDGDHAVYAEQRDGSRTAIVTSTESRTERRDVYVPAREGMLALQSYLSPDRKWVLIAGRRDHDVGQPCIVVPFDGSNATRDVGIPGMPCATAAWSPDGRWMYFELLSSQRQAHIWRQAFPGGAPEQITAGPTVEHGIAVAPDGASLITSVGSTHFAIWLHDENGERPLSTEGMAWLINGTFFSRDGRRVYYVAMPPDQLSVADLGDGVTEKVFPGLSAVQGYCISSDEAVAALVRLTGAGTSDLWIGPPDRTKPPRNLGRVESNFCAFGPRHDLYFLKEDQDGINSVHRLDYDTGSEKKMFSGVIGIFSVSRGGDWAVVSVQRDTSVFTVARPLAGGDDVPLCSACRAHWSTDGRFLLLSFFSYGGPGYTRMHVLPVAADTPVPETFASGPKSEEELMAAMKQVAGATTIERKDALRYVPSPNPTTYAYQRMTTQRNLYRIPLR